MMNLVGKRIKCNLEGVQVQSIFNFKYLINKIEILSQSEKSYLQQPALDLMTKLENATELSQPVVDKSVLLNHASLFEELMSYVISPFNFDNEISAIFQMYDNNPIYSSNMFKNKMNGEHFSYDLACEGTDNDQLISLLYQTFFIILKKEYALDIPEHLPLVFKQFDKKKQICKYYDIYLDTRFLEVKTIDKVPKLSREEIHELISRDNDLDFWNEKIPLKKYIVEGFLKISFLDVTNSFLISELKTDLLHKEVFISEIRWNNICKKIASLVGNSKVEFGYTSISGLEFPIERRAVSNTIVPITEWDSKDLKTSIFAEAYQTKQILLTDDLASWGNDSMIQAYIKNGIRNYAVVPLIVSGDVIGLLEFGACEPDVITMVQIKFLHEIFPVFAMSLKRSKDDWNDRIQALIQERYTAIHSTVEWKFKEVAADLLNVQSNDRALAEGIVFQNVIPIYGASDIQASSIERNKAIQKDLVEQLIMALDIMKLADDQTDIPLLDNLIYKALDYLKILKRGLGAGDELSILDFLKKEVNPILLLLKDRYPISTELIDVYFNGLDSELGVILKRRKDYDDTISLINKEICKIIESGQEQVQKVFPHYFEKYSTDGVEYNAYIGQSLVNNLHYYDIYLNNLRLWQLLLKVKIARAIKKLHSQMRLKLDVTQLILVHSSPLTIEFRQDEKKFDVNGSYNIRYEIIKKRIDKALILGTRQRVTQVGKIAVIYSHADEICEYRKYIDYMIAKKYLKKNIEELKLADLKGVSGLKAVRLEVNFEYEEVEDFLISDLMKMKEFSIK